MSLKGVYPKKAAKTLLFYAADGGITAGVMIYTMLIHLVQLSLRAP